MARQSKGAHLIWQSEYRDKKTGRLIYNASWIIRDGGKTIRTGCGQDELAQAQMKLAEYLTELHKPSRDSSKDPSEILISDVVSIYFDDKKDSVSSASKLAGRLERIILWWGMKTLAEVNGKTCRDYVAYRVAQSTKTRKVTPPTVRRELSDLRAAINHHRKEGLCHQVVEVLLPPAGKPKEVFLTRSEAAKLLWIAWTRREKQKRKHDGLPSDDKRETRKRTCQHVARFILVGLYTGTRHAAILGASFEPAENRGWIDMKRGVFHRLRQGQQETKKRQTPARLPSRLMAHLERWHRLGISKKAIVEYQGEPVDSVKVAFGSIVKEANLGKHVTPHTLRHTAATWLMDEGHKVWQAAGYLGMSSQVLEQVYAKHHPDYQIEMVDAFQRHRAKKVTGF